jgi:hypothetical protein
MSKQVPTGITALFDAVAHPLGTARLLAGASTLRRADDARVTLDQMRATFPDLEPYGDAALRGFIDVSRGLMTGRIRIERPYLGGEAPQRA